MLHDLARSLNVRPYMVDLAALASIGLRTRKLRATLSALGIAIGVAAIVAVLGLAASAKAEAVTFFGRPPAGLRTPRLVPLAPADAYARFLERFRRLAR